MIELYRCVSTLVLLFFITSCATVKSVTRAGDAKKWENLKASSEFQKEKELFTNRIGGKTLCPKTGVATFTLESSISPSKTCLYPASSFVVNSGDMLDSPSLMQLLQTLKVVQVLPDGFLVKSWSVRNNSYQHDSPEVVFIHKTDEEGVVDGAYLDNAYDYALYEYMGTYNYTSVSGASRTVHSFKKLSKKEIESAKKDLKVYGVIKEFFIENKLWDYLGDYEPK